jgi:VIT1/CCC1 family predicted Fe2+/Mn2+ transporter
VTGKIHHSKARKNSLSFFVCAVEVVGWLQIVLSPFLTGVIIIVIVYFSNPSTQRLIVAIVVAFIGLLVGIVFATKVLKKEGTIHFVPRITANPELDNLGEGKK